MDEVGARTIQELSLHSVLEYRRNINLPATGEPNHPVLYSNQDQSLYHEVERV